MKNTLPHFCMAIICCPDLPVALKRIFKQDQATSSSWICTQGCFLRKIHLYIKTFSSTVQDWPSLRASLKFGVVNPVYNAGKSSLNWIKTCFHALWKKDDTTHVEDSHHDWKTTRTSRPSASRPSVDDLSILSNVKRPKIQTLEK